MWVRSSRVDGREFLVNRLSEASSLVLIVPTRVVISTSLALATSEPFFHPISMDRKAAPKRTIPIIAKGHAKIPRSPKNAAMTLRTIAVDRDVILSGQDQNTQRILLQFLGRSSPCPRFSCARQGKGPFQKRKSLREA